MQDNFLREAAGRALFQAHLLILHWMSQTVPTQQMWIDHLGMKNWSMHIEVSRISLKKYKDVSAGLGPSRHDHRQIVNVKRQQIVWVKLIPSGNYPAG